MYFPCPTQTSLGSSQSPSIEAFNMPMQIGCRFHDQITGIFHEATSFLIDNNKVMVLLKNPESFSRKIWVSLNNNESFVPGKKCDVCTTLLPDTETPIMIFKVRSDNPLFLHIVGARNPVIPQKTMMYHSAIRIHVKNESLVGFKDLGTPLKY
jgi:hypothetical protein